MAEQSPLRLIKRSAEYIPIGKRYECSDRHRGLYVLYQYEGTIKNIRRRI